MKYIIQSKIVKTQKVKKKDKEDIVETYYNNSTSSFDAEKNLTVSEIKKMCKDFFGDLGPQEIEKEVLLFGKTEKTNDSEVIEPISGLKYNLYLK